MEFGTTTAKVPCPPGKLPLIPKVKGQARKKAVGAVGLRRAAAKRTQEQRCRNAIMAGLASGRARKARASFRETVLAICETPVGQELLEAMGFDTDRAAKLAGNLTNLQVATIAVMQRAHEGNLQAWQTMRDTVGEMPTQKTEVSNIGPPPTLNVSFSGEE